MSYGLNLKGSLPKTHNNFRRDWWGIIESWWGMNKTSKISFAEDKGVLAHMNKNITIGKNKEIGPGVLLGVSPSRKVDSLKLVIGDHAHMRSGTVIYLGSRIGSHLETGHNAVIREENEIGNHFALWSNSVVDYQCKIGNNVKIHCNCYIAQFTTLEDDVFIAPGTIVSNDLHPGSPNAIVCMKGPTLKRGVQIGCNVTLLPHVTIGEHSLIGAGSVVTKDIPPYSVAYGNPARVHKKVTELKCSIKNHFPYDFLLDKLNLR